MNLYERLKQEPATTDVLAKEFKINPTSINNKLRRLKAFFPEIRRRRISTKKPNQRKVSRFLYYIVD